jgi:hypothetical protein
MLINEINQLHRLFKTAPSERVYRRIGKIEAAARTGSICLSGLVQMARLLFIIGPSALVWNRQEAAASDEQFAEVPTLCTSITIEITV